MKTLTLNFQTLTPKKRGKYEKCLYHCMHSKAYCCLVKSYKDEKLCQLYAVMEASHPPPQTYISHMHPKLFPMTTGYLELARLFCVLAKQVHLILTRGACKFQQPKGLRTCFLVDIRYTAKFSWLSNFFYLFTNLSQPISHRHQIVPKWNLHG